MHHEKIWPSGCRCCLHLLIPACFPGPWSVIEIIRAQFYRSAGSMCQERVKTSSGNCGLETRTACTDLHSSGRSDFLFSADSCRFSSSGRKSTIPEPDRRNADVFGGGAPVHRGNFRRVQTWDEHRAGLLRLQGYRLDLRAARPRADAAKDENHPPNRFKHRDRKTRAIRSYLIPVGGYSNPNFLKA